MLFEVESVSILRLARMQYSSVASYHRSGQPPPFSFCNDGLMKKYAILIDGGFLRKTTRQSEPLDSEAVQRFIEQIKAKMPDADLHRVYFYDAKPLAIKVKNPLGGEVDFSKSKLSKNSTLLFSGLKNIDFVALRMGELVFRGWFVPKHKLIGDDSSQLIIGADDIQPDVKQKGVDMRIGLDIAALVLKSHVETIVLVTADADFVPAMKFARREGAQVFLVPMAHRIHASMIEHSDKVIKIEH